ncbi:hypothetical protein V8F33_000598 [Rhypophila sp. PSN 637]
MARELRSSKAKAAAPEEKPAPAKKSTTVKAAKVTKTEKRKAPEDASIASPVATKKAKATKTKKVVEEVVVEEEVEKVVAPKKGKAKGKKAAPAPEPEPEAMDEDEEEEAPAPAAPTPKSALKKVKASPAASKTNGTPVSEKKTKAASKKSTPAKVKEVEQEAEEEEEEETAPASDNDEPEDEEDLDDNTKALAKTFQDSDNEDEQEEPAKKSTYKTGQDVGKIPKQKKAPKTAPPAIKGKSGVVYLGRIPHGFYEHQIRAYFSQFGPISNIRVARNKKTGASRHFAFIEFEEHETADIAARTMDKYLLFGHLLICKLVKPENVHPDLFKGANRRFKVVPWNKMQGKQLERPKSESQWNVRISKEEQRRAKRAEKLQAMGYEFEAPALKAPEAKEVIEPAPAPAAIEAAATEENGVAAVEEKGDDVESEAVEAPPEVVKESEEQEEAKAKETPVKKAAKEKKGSATKVRKSRRSSTK